MTGLSRLPSLHTLRIYKTAIDFDSFIAQQLPPSLNRLAFSTAKEKQDRGIEKKLTEMGLR